MKARKDQQHIEGHANPQVCNDDCNHCGCWAGQPHHRVVNNVQGHQEVVDHAEVRVEHPAEDRARDNGGKDPCDQKERANNAVTRERFTEEQGQRVTNKELQGKRGNCPDDGELHAIPEAWALHHRFIVR